MPIAKCQPISFFSYAINNCLARVRSELASWRTFASANPPAFARHKDNLPMNTSTARPEVHDRHATSPESQPGMNFEFTDEQNQLRKSVREFAEREILPHVMEWDEASHFPLETVKELGRLGLMGSIFPVEYGGSGMGYVEYVIAIEELSHRRFDRHHRGRAHFALLEPHL